MTALIIFLCLILLAIIIVQYGKFRELTARIRGEEEAALESNNRNAMFGVFFMIVFLVLCVVSALYYKNWMLGYGPHESASVHGHELDSLFNTTMFFTGIVFVLTHIALFWYAYKYRYNKDRKVLFLAHDTTLEVVWTAIPAITMCFLVVNGLIAWNKVTADIPEGEIPSLLAEGENEYIEIEAMGQQFAWLIRYPGADGLLGERNYKLFSSNNPFGQNWDDDKNLDDFHPSEIVLPKGKKVRVRITSKDVLHNFDLPHFRVKMDAVPGLPTHWVFTPELTTEEYRNNLRQYEDYHAPSDPEDPDSAPLWKAFDYELACAELCGKGHYSMRRVVRIVEQDEYERWLAEQKSWYFTSIVGTDDDPHKDLNKLETIPAALAGAIANEFNSEAQAALDATDAAKKTVILKHVYYNSGSYSFSGITEKYYLSNLVKFMKKNPDVKIQLSGHTDSDGDDASNQILSENRANAIATYLGSNGIDASRFSAVGYGETQPIDTNATAEGKANNRRTAFTILASEKVAVEVEEAAVLTE